MRRSPPATTAAGESASRPNPPLDGLAAPGEHDGADMEGGAGGHGPDHAVCHHRRVRGTRMVTALLAPAAFVLVACGGASGERTARTQTTTPAREPTAAATTAAVGPSWPTYGGSASRSG